MDWGVDVFVHKNNVPTPWNLGQPVEFAVQVNQRSQPQAYDCNWLPRLQSNSVTPGTTAALPGRGSESLISLLLRPFPLVKPSKTLFKSL